MNQRDDALREKVHRALDHEPLLGDCRIDPGLTGDLHGACVLFPEGYSGRIDVTVHAGVVTLRGEVSHPCERRIAARIARELGGCRGVVNALRVAP